MQVFLKPTYYLPEEDKQLRTIVQIISMQEGKSHHVINALALKQQKTVLKLRHRTICAVK